MEIQDLHGKVGWLWFRFGGYIDIDIIDTLKLEVPKHERAYLPKQKHLWGVKDTPQNRQTLTDLFENGEEALEELEASYAG